MNKIDELWYILTKSILNTKNDFLFIYDKMNDNIFVFDNRKSSYEPHFKNKTLKEYSENEIKNFYLEIENMYKVILDKYIKKDSCLIQLNPISNIEIEFFISFFISNINDNDIKVKVSESIDEHNLDEVARIISKINFNLSMEFSQKLGEFLKEKIIKNYFKFGINEKTDIIW